MTYRGQCRCGQVSLEFRTDLEAHAMQLRSCQCEFCRSHKAVTATDPHGSVGIRFKTTDGVIRQRFALQTADYLTCKKCQTYIGAIIESSGQKFCTINVRLIPAFEPHLARAVPVAYEGESKQSRIERRIKNWTPVKVHIE